VQVSVLPISDRHAEYAGTVKNRLAASGLRVHLDDRSEKVNAKIREAQLQKVPYMLVVGDREAERGTVSVRNRRHGDQGAMAIDDFLAKVLDQVRTRLPVE
jgi:threonyl-tRNA synthetase